MIKQSWSVGQWVEYIQTLHHREIELSLERVRQVYSRLYPNGLPYKIITVAGTNGKGSTSEIISSIYHQAGHRVGKFSSPHLIDFAERYSICGADVGEEALLQAFNKIEHIREEIPITFFEFGALLAIELFSAAKVDVAVMEVGLGGRLDAINILDADIAIITSISIDHTAWLGNTEEEIGREKAGIARPECPCIVGIRKPPQSILNYCSEIGANIELLGLDYDYLDHSAQTQSWEWFSQKNNKVMRELPLPFSQAGVQLSNASVAVHAVQMLEPQLPVEERHIISGLERASILARCQIVSEQPFTVLDVAHNESSMTRLRAFINQHISRKNTQGDVKIYAVCGMLQDKEVAKSLACFSDIVTHWSFASINNERGATAAYLSEKLTESKSKFPIQLSIKEYDSIPEAYLETAGLLSNDDILVVFGSFFVAGDILKIIT